MGNFSERGMFPLTVLVKENYYKISSIKILSWSQNWNINLILAAATKVDEEKDLELLVDDAGGEGMSTTDAITFIGAAILSCFILACCCIVICKK